MSNCKTCKYCHHCPESISDYSPDNERWLMSPEYLLTYRCAHPENRSRAWVSPVTAKVTYRPKGAMDIRPVSEGRRGYCYYLNDQSQCALYEQAGVVEIPDEWPELL